MLPLNELAGATCAGCASTLIGHPFDSVKVHLQARPHLVGPIGAASDLLHSGGGVGSFFRGVGPPMANAVLMNTIMFAAFDGAKTWSVFQGVPGGEAGRALAAGLMSGFVTACVSTPADLIKIRAQLSGLSSAAALGEVWSNKGTIARGGPLALFRGHIPNLGREGVFTMVYLGLYDIIIWGGGGGVGGGSDEVAAGASSSNTNFWRIAAASSLTGALAWVASYPFDTIKTVVQGSDRRITLGDAASQIWREGGGWRAFYRGCGTSTWRAMLVTSSRMVVYEAVRDLLGSNR